jgi:hypothetical protein
MVRAIPLPDVNLFIFFEAAVWNSFCFLASLIRSAAQIDHPPDACCHKQTTMPRELMSGLTYEKKYLKCGLFAEENKKGVTKNPAIKSNICMYICMYVCIYIYISSIWRPCLARLQTNLYSHVDLVQMLLSFFAPPSLHPTNELALFIKVTSVASRESFFSRFNSPPQTRQLLKTGYVTTVFHIVCVLQSEQKGGGYILQVILQHVDFFAVRFLGGNGRRE